MKTEQPSSLGLIILSMLLEAPMHAYRMQKLIRDRGKDKVVNVRQRTSIHQALERLRRLGLIQVQGMQRSQEGRPERTVYEITPEGRRAAHDWLGRMLTTLSPEFPDFPAAVSVLAMISQAEAEALLARRAEVVGRSLAAVEAGMREAGALPRVFLLEDEYRIAMLSAERRWLEGVLADLRGGGLAWDEAKLRAMAAAVAAPDRDG
jgi:DNA-binding PadR family transcriptional regulator